jgi:heat shock protein HslJ
MRFAERRLLIVTTAGLVLAWAAFFLSVLDPRGRWVAETFGPPEDGGWVAVSIDGRSVRKAGFTLFIDGGEPRSGHDGCNSWSRITNENGQVGIESTLVECPPDPLHAAYRQIVLGEQKMRLQADDTLFISGAGHRALFRRQRD